MTKATKTLTEQLIAIEAQIKKLEEKRDTLAVAIENEAALSNLSPGSTIRFNYGRAATRKELEGVVLGVQDTDKGRRIKVQYGEGFAADVVVVDPAAVVEVVCVAATVA
ncbi:hypothetical protein HOR55_gp34 [Ralstonia phage RS-PII-1]|uniref:Uncharacterized protein n=1 Tax=Ralstonia phage RS-PII-1 TaxID=1932892 RepID=A0A1L7DQC3_9CAUD|nr:hypothetical protein HOR55_gp34 [Ralstonia phage RS-PII-1]APU00321.1 hypothetical protein [Ralstonia phage RS-PII-1]